MTVTRATRSSSISAAPPGAHLERAGARSVLLAIANSQTRRTLRVHLGEQGFTVYGTGDARVAIEWLQRRRADVVVADVLLPGTRIALPHVLRRRGGRPCPKLIGLADGDAPCDAIRSALSYDVVFHSGTAAAVITKGLHQLLETAPPQS